MWECRISDPRLVLSVLGVEVDAEDWEAVEAPDRDAAACAYIATLRASGELRIRGPVTVAVREALP
jgi:hypothetical protein